MRYLLMLVIVFIPALSGLLAQNDITPIVSSALKKGDAETLSSFFTPSVELTVMGKEGVFQEDEARKILGQFFKENTPQSFTIKHQGTSKLDDQFRIGDLTTQKGVFRVTYFMKKSNNAFQIKQLKIEPAG